MAIELRCDFKKHGVITDDGLLEVKCNSNRCGANKRTVVLHYFDPTTGLLKNTEKFREPNSLFNKGESLT